MFTLVPALIGAMIGSIGAVVVEKSLDRRRENSQAREALVQRHISQLQDAIEDLYFRLDNLWNRDGYYAMEDDEYFEITTLYALGKVLAVERTMSLEEVYPQLDILNKSGEYRNFGSSLRSHRKALQLRDLFEELNLHRYAQRVLAESAMGYDTSNFRPSTFLEFNKRYCEADEAQGQKWLSSARVKVHRLYGSHTFTDAKKGDLLSSLEQVAYMLADKTMVDSAISSKSSNIVERTS